MVATTFLFPRSQYLNEQWWHRLATVVFWAWLVFVCVSCLNTLVLDPFSSCMQTKIQSEILLGKPSDLNCGSNAFGYAFLNFKETAALEAAGATVFFVSVLFLFLAIPGLFYRIVLYIAKGSSWKDTKVQA
jgi:hypothetical protein